MNDPIVGLSRLAAALLNAHDSNPTLIIGKESAGIVIAFDARFPAGQRINADRSQRPAARLHHQHLVVLSGEPGNNRATPRPDRLATQNAEIAAVEIERSS
jgi:hypothetical protein